MLPINYKIFGSHLINIFKTITFDNGYEYVSYKDIEIKTGPQILITKVYIDRLYRWPGRCSNDNWNRVVKYTIKKEMT